MRRRRMARAHRATAARAGRELQLRTARELLRSRVRCGSESNDQSRRNTPPGRFDANLAGMGIINALELKIQRAGHNSGAS